MDLNDEDATEKYITITIIMMIIMIMIIMIIMIIIIIIIIILVILDSGQYILRYFIKKIYCR